MKQYTMRPGNWFGLLMFVCIMMEIPAILIGHLWAAAAAGMIWGLWVGAHYYGGFADSYRDMVQRSLNAYKVYQDE